jgi:phage tail-like protein
VPGLPLEATPRRVATSASGAVHLLFGSPSGEAWIVALDRPAAAIPAPGAHDLEVAGDGSIVVAVEGYADLFRLRDGLIEERLAAARDTGAGLVRTPDGRIGFWTPEGLRIAVTARQRYRPRGRVTTYALDAGEYGTEWGRLFIDACVHQGSELKVRCTTADEPPEGPALPRTPPENATGPLPPRSDLSPPMVPLALLPEDPWDGLRPVHRRETGVEIPWLRRAADDPVSTYEAPVDAPPGRFLWVEIEMTGTGRRTPKLRALRAERPGHDLLDRLPRSFSREGAVAGFLRRYLATLEGDLNDLSARAEERHALLDARTAPEELLPWLASFLGLVLDERWPPAARRTLVAEATRLFARRGTVGGLTRLLSIYLGVAPVLVEHYRLRGLGPLLGTATTAATRSVLGAGLRVGGATNAGGPSSTSSPGGALGGAAHRFTVLLPTELDAVGMSVVRDILDEHRPAHTAVAVCTVGAGIRVGRGMHVALSSIVGRDSGFAALEVGDRLGRDGVMGRPEPGIVAGAGRLGHDSRVG